MSYNVNIPEFEGPLDLLLHLIKQSNISILDIKIEEITKQYLTYIEMMQNMNLNIASEYLVMAAELIEIKSISLLPKTEIDEDEYEENTKENLINRLLEYEKYKNTTKIFKQLEEFRHEVFTREPNNLCEYKNENLEIDYGVDLDDLLSAFSKLLSDKELYKPLNTKITNKEYSIAKRSHEIKKFLRNKKRIDFIELFDNFSKSYIVVTFLAILNLAKKKEIQIEQKNNFKNIIIKGCE